MKKVIYTTLILSFLTSNALGTPRGPDAKPDIQPSIEKMKPQAGSQKANAYRDSTSNPLFQLKTKLELRLKDPKMELNSQEVQAINGLIDLLFMSNTEMNKDLRAIKSEYGDEFNAKTLAEDFMRILAVRDNVYSLSDFEAATTKSTCMLVLAMSERAELSLKNNLQLNDETLKNLTNSCLKVALNLSEGGAPLASLIGHNRQALISNPGALQGCECSEDNLDARTGGMMGSMGRPYGGMGSYPKHWPVTFSPGPRIKKAAQ